MTFEVLKYGNEKFFTSLYSEYLPNAESFFTVNT